MWSSETRWQITVFLRHIKLMFKPSHKAKDVDYPIYSFSHRDLPINLFHIIIPFIFLTLKLENLGGLWYMTVTFSFLKLFFRYSWIFFSLIPGKYPFQMGHFKSPGFFFPIFLHNYFCSLRWMYLVQHLLMGYFIEPIDDSHSLNNLFLMIRQCHIFFYRLWRVFYFVEPINKLFPFFPASISFISFFVRYIFRLPSHLTGSSLLNNIRINTTFLMLLWL